MIEISFQANNNKRSKLRRTKGPKLQPKKVQMKSLPPQYVLAWYGPVMKKVNHIHGFKFLTVDAASHH